MAKHVVLLPFGGHKRKMVEGALDDLNDEGDLLDYYNNAFIVHVNAPTKLISSQAYGSGEDISLCSTVDYT